LGGDPIGELSEDGLLTVDSSGVAVIIAKLSDFEASATVTAIDPSSSDEEKNTINISRVLPDGHVLPSEELAEGESYHIGGLPYPLNLLNGGLIYFPDASLHDDITIHILLPDNAQVQDTTVSFDEGNVMGVRFVVMIGDSTAEPFYFDKPLNIAIPFKRDLLDELGLKPQDLGLFFEEAGDYVSEGLTNITVDSVKNKIFAKIEHFSTIVIRKKKETETDAKQNNAPIPTTFSLQQNYPNPFNPSTHIDYDLPQSAHVTLTIYNHLGRRVARLVNEAKSAGHYSVIWNGKNQLGKTVTSGVYFYKLTINGKRTITRKMLLLK